jgi:hypothetical protein
VSRSVAEHPVLPVVTNASLQRSKALQNRRAMSVT